MWVFFLGWFSRSLCVLIRMFQTRIVYDSNWEYIMHTLKFVYICNSQTRLCWKIWPKREKEKAERSVQVLLFWWDLGHFPMNFQFIDGLFYSTWSCTKQPLSLILFLCFVSLSLSFSYLHNGICHCIDYLFRLKRGLSWHNWW